jgi:tetratricopeptide (TPR) repeat protein
MVKFPNSEDVPLAIPNTLPEDEQEKLKGFLRDLSGGKSFVLFGSRGKEPWLEKETFGGNRYQLGGLDPEARSDLAVRILKKIGIELPKEDLQFHQLMGLLAGSPLAMEVILPNLKHHTSAQIIESLKAGDIDLERQDGKDKTESILKCVDYSHGNLSPDAQKLLLCLAPFTSMINLGFLPQYTEQLKRFSTFGDWPFQLWEKVIQETVNWGLMEPLGQDMPIMSLQPVFPYFLRIKLQQTLDETGREHLNQAFMAHYDGVAGFINTLFDSKKPKEKQTAMVLAGLKYENIYAALEMCLQRKQSIHNTYICLSDYIDAIKDQYKGLHLGEMVLKKIEEYPPQLLKGQAGAELATVVDDIAARFLLTKQLKQAKEAYLRALGILQSLTGFEEKQKALLTASIYHQLGMVAQEIREFEEARKNYEKALEIFIEFKDRYKQEVVKRSLETLEERKG